MSETNAKTSETNAQTYATNASNNAASASTSATNAKVSEDAAKLSETNASSSAASASTNATNAADSAKTAKEKADEVTGYANASKSYAVGGTGTRDGEDTDNAKYYYEKMKAVSTVDIATVDVAGIVKPDGTTITIDPDGTLHGSLSGDFATKEDLAEYLLKTDAAADSDKFGGETPQEWEIKMDNYVRAKGGVATNLTIGYNEHVDSTGITFIDESGERVGLLGVAPNGLFRIDPDYDVWNILDSENYGEYIVPSVIGAATLADLDARIALDGSALKITKPTAINAVLTLQGTDENEFPCVKLTNKANTMLYYLWHDGAYLRLTDEYGADSGGVILDSDNFMDYVLPEDIGAAPSSHGHASSEITGLGAAATYAVTTSVSAGSTALVTSGAVYGQLVNKANAQHTHDGYASLTHNQSASTILSGMFGGSVFANATSQATLTSAQVRNIKMGTDELTAGTSTLAAGTIYIQYE